MFGGALPVSTVHDEILVEADAASADQVGALLADAMLEAFRDVFPNGPTKLLATPGVGRTWAEAKADGDARQTALRERIVNPEQGEAPSAEEENLGKAHRRLKALDLFCCSGGVSRGLMDAGFHVTGVDIDHQPRYVGDRFIRGDVLSLDLAFLQSFDFIWSSPPCQALSAMKVLHNAKPHLNLIPQTRELLEASGKPYVIENVEGAREYLIDPILLCGTIYPRPTAGLSVSPPATDPRSRNLRPPKRKWTGAGRMRAIDFCRCPPAVEPYRGGPHAFSRTAAFPAQGVVARSA